MNLYRIGAFGAIAAAVSACAGAQPSKQLADARTVVSQASNGDAGKYAPDDLLEAKKTLDKAEKASDGSAEEIQYAYLADREARLAEAHGEAAHADRQAKEAAQKYTDLQASGRLSAEDQLAQTRADNQRLSGNLSASEKARQDAEARASAALASLNTLAAVKEEANETVITLSGQVLFKTNEATLLPIAEQSLSRVATALKDVPADRKIVINGYTDSRGDDESNRKLSEARAQSVMGYLTSHGVDASRITAVGKGETEPVATNDTAEGRANNRRVELVIQKGQTGGSTADR
jgi:outer membrane protein OmpA-like peptidoglycan-associated protein